MTDNHPITPPTKLIAQWVKAAPGPFQEEYIAIEAARWGADMELEACCKWLPKLPPWSADDLRKHRRPKPSSLKEQAKFAAAVLRSPDETCSIAELQQHWHTICNALEQLND